MSVYLFKCVHVHDCVRKCVYALKEVDRYIQNIYTNIYNWKVYAEADVTL